MQSKYFTVVIVPDANSQSKQLKVPRRMIRGIIGGTVFSLLSLALFAVSYVDLFSRSRRLDTLTRENIRLSEQIAEYDRQGNDIKQKLFAFQDYKDKISSMMGIEPAPSPDTGPGIGPLSQGDYNRPAGFEDEETDLADLAKMADQLDGKFQQVVAQVDDKSLLLASTPSVWPVRGWVSSNFGSRRDPMSGLNQFHKGVDISTPLGRPVASPAEGVVVFANYYKGFGKVLRIRHAFGYETYYGHLDRFAVRVGQTVKRGQVIAYVGNTGKATGTHLHYEVHVNGKPVNPMNFVLEETMDLRDLG
jgi:murein DD-endopeptidase MepM/ murein hydrolase activator NlpD